MRSSFRSHLARYDDSIRKKPDLRFVLDGTSACQKAQQVDQAT
jgi:hypothetical protein